MASWSVSEQGWRKGPWTPEEDKLLTEYISENGEGRWSAVARCSGLNRSGKSCRLRWVNYLKPGLKRGHITPQEEGIIIELHALWGNKWSTIARYLPGRTDNEIKNYWRTHFKKTRKLPSDKQQRRRLLREKQKQEDGTIKNESSPCSQPIRKDHTMLEPQSKREITDQNDFDPMIINQDMVYWTDTNPVENYLWEGLWNLDEYTSNCSKTDIQNQANNAYSCEGDSTFNMHTGGYIF